MAIKTIEIYFHEATSQVVSCPVIIIAAYKNDILFDILTKKSDLVDFQNTFWYNIFMSTKIDIMEKSLTETADWSPQ